jgi:hypothetical protein
MLKNIPPGVIDKNTSSCYAEFNNIPVGVSSIERVKR